MIRKGTTAVGISVVFALVLGAVGTSNASAAGTTAFTCVKDPPIGNLSGAHCHTTPSGEYKHVEIRQDETTTGTVTNANTAASTTASSSTTLKGALSGVVTEITCPEVHGEGMTFENRKAPPDEMFFHFEGKLHYTGCVVKAPSGKGCKISGETITTNQVTGTTLGQGHAVKLEAKEGSTIESVKIEGCSIESLNNTFPLTGTFKAQINGATLTKTEVAVTTENTLKFAGVKAGVEGALTFKAHSKAGEETTPLSFTTVP